MFNYSDKTIVNMQFKMLELFRTIKADKTIKADAENITAVSLSHIISPERTKLTPSDNVKEIYIITINQKTSRVPDKFLDAFNKQILFQTIFKLCYNKEVKYITSIKTFTEEKMKILKQYETEWQKDKKIDFPMTTKLDVILKTAIQYITGYAFRQEEVYDQYVERLSAIKRQKIEIDRLTKIMNAEKQPNIRMNLNDKIKQLAKELKAMEASE